MLTKHPKDYKWTRKPDRQWMAGYEETERFKGRVVIWIVVLALVLPLMKMCGVIDG